MPGPHFAARRPAGEPDQFLPEPGREPGLEGRGGESARQAQRGVWGASVRRARRRNTGRRAGQLASSPASGSQCQPRIEDLLPADARPGVATDQYKVSSQLLACEALSRTHVLIGGLCAVALAVRAPRFVLMA